MPRPKGLPKTGGRFPGTPNKTTAATRERIEREADPVAFLSRVMRGEEIDGKIPTLEHRIDVAAKLLNKIAPDMKELAHSASGARSDEDRSADARAVRERVLARLDRIAVARLEVLDRPPPSLVLGRAGDG